jgi:hypothetical protein
MPEIGVKFLPYASGMNLEIVEKHYHPNGNCAPFIVAVVDDVDSNDTKLVIMFDDEELTAVLSLDTIIDSEDVSADGNGWNAAKYDRVLRPRLWGVGEEDYEYVDDADEDTDE